MSTKKSSTKKRVEVECRTIEVVKEILLTHSQAETIRKALYIVQKLAKIAENRDLTVYELLELLERSEISVYELRLKMIQNFLDSLNLKDELARGLVTEIIMKALANKDYRDARELTTEIGLAEEVKT
ncbi:hypothetical protein DRP05_14975 [Archaeoglobales archaeon]|nr:MAG: hypothetical protein DRP05_14975 [Archaeoglobales archaeon]